MDSKPANVTRRDFVAGSASIALGALIGPPMGALIGPPMIVPRHVLGRGFQAPSDTLNIAYVGIGGMGISNWTALLSERTVAVCDVDYPYFERSLAGRLRVRPTPAPPPTITGEAATAWVAARDAEIAKARQEALGVEAAYKGATKYADYREMMDKQKDIDAVLVATPDHMHAMIALRAMQAGKHVYVQKPLTYSVMEARALAKMSRDNPRIVTQMGNQGHSAEGTRRIRELIRAGVIGDVKEVHIWTDRPQRYWAQGIPRPTAVPAPTAAPAVPAQWNMRTVDRAVLKAMSEVQQTPPDGLNWDLFCGAAPLIPYHPSYHPFSWRGWLDFGVSAIGDMGAHLMDQAFWALDLTYPTSITASSTPWGGGNNTPASYPLSTMVEYEFMLRGNKPMKMMWYDGGLLPPRPRHMPDDLRFGAEGGGIFIGTKGILMHETYGANVKVFPQSLEEKVARVPQSETRITTSHEMNWADACKGTGAASSPFSYAAPLTELMLLGIVALRAGQGRKILYDGDAMRVTNAPEANAYLTREYRAGWGLTA
jgi:predicted dehydrogenase